MANIDEEPIRLKTPGPYRRLGLPVLRETPLPSPSRVQIPFLEALTWRRSANDFGPIQLEDLATWLYYTGAIQYYHAEDPNRQRRFVGSLGALHPAHIILGEPNGTWSAYIPERHALGHLHVDEDVASKLRTRAEQYFKSAIAILIVLVSDSNLVENYYQNADGLVLRDAGVLLGHAALVAAALGFTFRILGGTGGRLVEEVVRDLPFKPVATGLALIGGPM